MRSGSGSPRCILLLHSNTVHLTLWFHSAPCNSGAPGAVRHHGKALRHAHCPPAYPSLWQGFFRPAVPAPRCPPRPPGGASRAPPCGRRRRGQRPGRHHQLGPRKGYPEPRKHRGRHHWRQPRSGDPEPRRRCRWTHTGGGNPGVEARTPATRTLRRLMQCWSAASTPSALQDAASLGCPWVAVGGFCAWAARPSRGIQRLPMRW
jgi:hypothetical protein